MNKYFNREPESTWENKKEIKCFEKSPAFSRNEREQQEKVKIHFLHEDSVSPVQTTGFRERG